MAYFKTRKPIGIIFLGAAAGFLYGLFVSIDEAYNLGYAQHKLYSLILFDLNHDLTKYTFIAVLYSVLALGLILIIKKAFIYFTHTRGKNRFFGILSSIAGSKLVAGIGGSALALVFVLNIFTFIYARAHTPEGPNILLISIDTLRADHLGSYGYGRDTSPNIDKLAEKGVLFENAYSQAPWTIPSIASILTGLYPAEHGADYQTNKLSDRMTTLAEHMKNNSYTTAAVISNTLLRVKHGFSQGFDIYNEKGVVKNDSASSQIVTDIAIKYLNKNR